MIISAMSRKNPLRLGKHTKNTVNAQLAKPGSKSPKDRWGWVKLEPLLMDDTFCLLRQKLPSRRRLFDDMKALTTYFCFDNWEHLINFMLESWSCKPENRIIRPPKTETG